MASVRLMANVQFLLRLENGGSPLLMIQTYAVVVTGRSRDAWVFRVQDAGAPRSREILSRGRLGYVHDGTLTGSSVITVSLFQNFAMEMVQQKLSFYPL